MQFRDASPGARRHRVTAGRLSLTVLGSSNSIPRPGRACSSYLVRAGHTSIALDLGSGAFGNLRRYALAEEVDAVVISHMHPDHFLDLIPMRYALRYGTRTNGRRPRLYLPPEGEALLRRLVEVFVVEDEAHFLDVYDVRTYDPNGELRLGEIALRFALTQHYIPAFAVRCEAGGASVTYSADTAPEPRVSELARRSDAFLCEATLRPGQPDGDKRGHSSAREAAHMAHRAEARKLLLTHYGSDASHAELASEARAEYAGEVVVGDDNLILSL